MFAYSTDEWEADCLSPTQPRSLSATGLHDSPARLEQQIEGGRCSFCFVLVLGPRGVQVAPVGRDKLDVNVCGGGHSSRGLGSGTRRAGAQANAHCWAQSMRHLHILTSSVDNPVDNHNPALETAAHRIRAAGCADPASW
jgi:hypothetical protein